MRKLLFLMLLLCALLRTTQAQTDTVLYISVPNSDIISGVSHAGGNIKPVFYDPAINAIINNYTVKHWARAFPHSPCWRGRVG